MKSRSWIVLFMLFSPVEKPIAKALSDFYEEMSSIDNICCITENAEYYEQWARQAFCIRTDLDNRSVVGLKWSHINATIQDMMPKKDFCKTLPVSKNAVCVLKIPKEEKIMHSLNILSLNECENTDHEAIDPNKLESDFYRGGRMTWMHCWFAEQNKCGAFIERHACKEVEDILDGILNKQTAKLPVATINIVHQPGSGGSTVARQILWKNKKKLRCAIVNTTYLSTQVCEHAVQLREYEETDVNTCLPVLLLLEDCSKEYIDKLKNKLQEAISYEKVRSKPCFILLSCVHSNAPEKMCKHSPDNSVAITQQLKPAEKTLFQAKAEQLKAKFSEDQIITFVLMSQDFNVKYLEDFVRNVLKNLDHSSGTTCLMRYVALLNHYVQNSYIPLSHCLEILGVQTRVDSENKLSQNQNLNSLREQALIIEHNDETTNISAIRILHPKIAEEILKQISIRYLQSKIAYGLLQETNDLNRIGQPEFKTFIKHLFFRRLQQSRGDKVDSLFSPLIEHVCKEEKGTEAAINLLRVAYEQFNQDPHFAQQLARIYYKNAKFVEAKKCIEAARKKLPNDSYILDTEGRLYKEWFNITLKEYKGDKSLDNGLIEHGLKSIECFRKAQNAAKLEKDTTNNFGYFGEVDMGLQLLALLLTLFKNRGRNKADLVTYLTRGTSLNNTNVPEELKHHGDKLQNLYQNIYKALQWISEDVGCFQTDKIDVWESKTRDDSENNPRKWLVEKTKIFAEYFSSENEQDQCTSAEKDGIDLKMTIYKHGGGNVATILSLFLSISKPEDQGSKLERIIECYPSEINEKKLDDHDLINLIMSHIALGSVCPKSTKLLKFEKLLKISKRFLNPAEEFPASAYFLIFMLYYPDKKHVSKNTIIKDNILEKAIKKANLIYCRRMKDIPAYKKKTNVLCFLGKGYGLQKFVFRGVIERLLKRPLTECTFFHDSDPKDQDKIDTMLKKVKGFTKNGKVFMKKINIEVVPVNHSSVPQGDEKVTFYLGFTYIGYVAYNIEVES